LAPPVFDQALSIGYFEGALREAIHQFKYRPCRSLGSPLGDWMSGNIQLPQGIDVIIPIPLHGSRLYERGFNQALLLADRIGNRFSIPVCYDNLVRTRPTRPQVELSGLDRVKNVAGAFSLVNPDTIKNTSIMLVDDVFTTGATVNECARILKAAGASHVAALTLARAV
jgi:ComF family protein